MIDEGDDDGRAEENEGGTDVIAPAGLNAIDGNGDVEGEDETKNLKEESKGDVRASLEEATEAEHHEIGKDKGGACRDGTL